jgi:hypothetical protein
MVTKRILFAFLVLFNVYIFASADDEFDFYAEDNIDESRLRTIEFLSPDLRSNGAESGISTFTIKVGNDGIIRSIVRTSTIPYYSSHTHFVYVYRKGNLINIKSSAERPYVNNIKWDNNNVYVRGVVGQFSSKTNDFTQMKILSGRDIIYEAPIIKLERVAGNSLKETDQTRVTSYSNNVTESHLHGNLDWRMEYTVMPNEIMAVYFYGMDGGLLKYPPAWIKFNGGGNSLYSSNQLVNVINQLILYTNSQGADDFLFPLLFLERPFSLKQWNYSASSYLKERNVEYGPNNLASQGGLPWASAREYGIGDKITIDMGTSPRNSITIINGYVSTERPDLFAANARVKQVKITNLNNGRNQTRTIEDSMIPQNININFLGPTQNTRIEIEILSVYQGSKYKDLCIQSIF